MINKNEKNFDSRSISFAKIFESEDFVWYKFGIDEIIGEYKDYKGRSFSQRIPRYGFFKFHKKTTTLKSDSFNLLEKNTYKPRLKDPHATKNLWMAIWRIMKECWEKNIYPQWFYYHI